MTLSSSRFVFKVVEKAEFQVGNVMRGEISRASSVIRFADTSFTQI
jgi:hypothetical protein